MRRGVAIGRTSSPLPAWLTVSLVFMLAWITGFVTAAIMLNKQSYSHVGI